MREQHFSVVMSLLCTGSLLTIVVWCLVDNNYAESGLPHPQKKSASEPSELCKGCKEVIDKVNIRYSETWKKHEGNCTKFRSALTSKCNGFHGAIVTQTNTPAGTKLMYDGDRKRSVVVSPEMFSTFIKEHPFLNKTWDTCAVVGNGGILANSSCGEMIDSADLVMRCNLPPLSDGYEKHVGNKTYLVTANPSILTEKYGALNGRRRPFAESLRRYGNAMILFPAFAFAHTTPISMRAFYTVEDFEMPTRVIFLNPQYIQKLTAFWRVLGLKSGRLSTGLIMASLALEVCSNVHLYGFWPFSKHPHSLQVLSNHYYDQRPANTKVHAMPVEFDLLLSLHSQGVLRLHLGECKPGKK
ncbi:alpha-2,8-sialyltransferase 8F-like [Pholidichthys leucotaenia]